MINVINYLFFLVWMIGLSSMSVNAQSCNLEKASLFAEEEICGKTAQGKLNRKTLTVSGIAIGSSTMRDVITKFKYKKIFKLQDAEASPIGVCVKNSKGEAVVFASGALGSWKTVTVIYLAEVSVFEKQGATCGATEKDIATENGIAIGISKDQLSVALRTPIRATNTVNLNFVRERASKGSDSKKSAYTQCFTGIHVGFHNQKVEWVRIYGLESTD